MWTHENRPKYNRDHLRYPSDLTDDEWAYVEPLIPPGSAPSVMVETHQSKAGDGFRKRSTRARLTAPRLC
jgi:hypothetical protein